MPSGRSDRYIVAVAAVALTTGGSILALRHRPVPPPLMVRSAAERTAPAGPRLIYPAGALPSLSLPDGRRQPIRSLLNVERPLHYGDYIWNDDGVPAGPAWVRVDLRRQTMSVFRDGHEIGSAIVLYGTDGTPTPTGIFPILARAQHHRSSLYDAEMPYMLRLTQDGVAIHASSVREGAATHGCIGIPEAFAARVFDTMRRGDEVVII